MNELIELDFIDLALALGLIGAAVVLSAWQKLGLEGQIIFAAGRSLLQLLVVGYVLAFVFALSNFWIVLIVFGVMLTVASIVARNRISKKVTGLLPLVWGSLGISSALTLGYVVLLIVQPLAWYDPQYLIPLTGMLLGNAMNGASLAGERLVSQLNSNRLEIETHLCLGATPQQAIASYRRDAIRIGLIPTLNQMFVVGLVSLPGMFTGQVLAGSDPLNAASYQLLILYAIAITNLAATALVTAGVYRKFFNQNAQLVLP